MKRIFVISFLMPFLLSACAVPDTPTTVKTELTVIPTLTDLPTNQLPSQKLPAPSFESQVYIDEKSGFAFDYPNGWTVIEPMVSERATQVQFLSSPDLANLATLPQGATRLSATLYDWDPKSDLAAYVTNWKTAWSASGFTILEEEELVLEQGLPAMLVTIQTPDAAVVHLITALGERYLVLSGEGNLGLVKEIVRRVRPISH